jgi:hypothetical protein
LRSCGTFDIPNDEAFVRSAVSGGWYDTRPAILNVVTGDDYGWRRCRGSHGCGGGEQERHRYGGKARPIGHGRSFRESASGGKAGIAARLYTPPKVCSLRQRNRFPHSKLSSAPRPISRRRPDRKANELTRDEFDLRLTKTISPLVKKKSPTVCFVNRGTVVPNGLDSLFDRDHELLAANVHGGYKLRQNVTAEQECDRKFETGAALDSILTEFIEYKSMATHLQLNPLPKNAEPHSGPNDASELSRVLRIDEGHVVARIEIDQHIVATHSSSRIEDTSL